MHWLAQGEGDLPPGTHWLAAAELDRLAAMPMPKRRAEYLLRRWTVKRAVAISLGLPHDPATMASIEALNHPSGAPYALVDGRPIEVDIGLTDRAGWAACLLGDPPSAGSATGPNAVGVDLELVEPRTDAFVADFLTEAERAYVDAQPRPFGRQVAANLIWSAKESALKVLRLGLRADTRTVQVTIGRPAGPDGWAALQVGTAAGLVIPGWWRRDGRFLLTVASVTAAPPPAQLPGSADLRHSTPAS